MQQASDKPVDLYEYEAYECECQNMNMKRRVIEAIAAARMAMACSLTGLRNQVNLVCGLYSVHSSDFWCCSVATPIKAADMREGAKLGCLWIV